MIHAAPRRRPSALRLLTRIAVGLTLSTVAFGPVSARQAPCAPGAGATLPGAWVPSTYGDDTAMADHTIPKADYPELLRRAGALADIIRKAAPDVAGLQASTYRNIRGDSYVANGPERYAATALFLGRYCAEAGAGRGSIKAEDETGTWIYIFVNELGWLQQQNWGDAFRTPKGTEIYWEPATNGTFKGETLYLPTIHVGQRTEAIVLTRDGKSPYDPVTRETFLLSRERQLDNLIADIRKRLTPASSPQTVASANKAIADNEARKAAIARVLDAMSPEERQLQAIVVDPNEPPEKGKLFVSESTRYARRLSTIAGRLFRDAEPRATARVIVVYWRWEDRSPAKVAMIQQFKEKLDVNALKALLGK